jgi:hypothetical protein
MVSTLQRLTWNQENAAWRGIELCNAWNEPRSFELNSGSSADDTRCWPGIGFCWQASRDHRELRLPLTTLAWENRLSSPDFIGPLGKWSSRAAAEHLFLQGASGKLAPAEQYVGGVNVRIAATTRLRALETLEGMLPGTVLDFHPVDGRAAGCRAGFAQTLASLAGYF